MKKLCSLLLLAITPVLLQANAFPFNSDMNDAQIKHLKNHTLTNVRNQIFDGWCPVLKADQMMDLIINTKPKVCVEIGVFGGASVYPTIMALRYNKHIGHPQGFIYAIDPWRNDEAVKNYTSTDVNADWWGRVDLREIKNKFIRTMAAEQIQDTCIVVPKTSADAAAEIPNDIDILHIDGNHTEASSVLDVQLYLPKVREGGYIWFDDIAWPTTQKAQDLLLQECDLIYKFISPQDAPKDQQASYMLVQKRIKPKAVAEETKDTSSKESSPSSVQPASSKSSEETMSEDYCVPDAIMDNGIC